MMMMMMTMKMINDDDDHDVDDNTDDMHWMVKKQAHGRSLKRLLHEKQPLTMRCC